MENTALISKAIEYIQKNPTENLSLQCIAENAGFSLAYFDALFQRHTGYSPVEYARLYKLTRSAIELRKTDRTILDLALAYGYSNPENYTRSFKAFYGVPPSEYREKYKGMAITWHDLSGRIGISRFRNSFPELKQIGIDEALDFLFLHNPLKLAEDIFGLTIAQTAAFTLGDTETLQDFIYVADYNGSFVYINFVCENEDAAIGYLDLLSKLPEYRFGVRIAPGNEGDWSRFYTLCAELGLVCRSGYDMVYPEASVDVPVYEGLAARELSVQDMPYIRVFQQKGGCEERFIRVIENTSAGLMNAGQMAYGLFRGSEILCLALPAVLTVRDLSRFDMGALFALEGTRDSAIELIWKSVIEYGLKKGWQVGNDFSQEDGSPIGVAWCQRVGLVKTAKYSIYRK